MFYIIETLNTSPSHTALGLHKYQVSIWKLPVSYSLKTLDLTVGYPLLMILFYYIPSEAHSEPGKIFIMELTLKAPHQIFDMI